MNKGKNLSESAFLKLFFTLVSVCFLVAAPAMPDRADMFTGLARIMTQPAKSTTNYFHLGGVAATFLNMGLVGLAVAGVYWITGAVANPVSGLAYLLTVGFGGWGIHLVNMWFGMLGVLICCVLRREKPGVQANAMIFSTGVAPLISDLLLRYPHQEVIGFNWLGLGLAVGAGLLTGLLLPAGLGHSPQVHKGFDLYSAALPVGLTAFYLQATLYKTMGIDLPGAPAAETLRVTARGEVNLFCLALFALFILLALLLGVRPRDYWRLLRGEKNQGRVQLMNFGVYGLCILAYYNIIGAGFNAVTFGVIFCMLSCGATGSHPGNVWPIVAGYWLASVVMEGLAGLLGGSFSGEMNDQAIVVGLCFANGLSPVVDKYGWGWGILLAGAHYILVTSVPLLHGGFCLYNGGFAAALICLLFMPALGHFGKTRQQRKDARKAKKEAIAE